MQLVLEVISGPHEGEKIEVAEGQAVRIGRTTKADIALQDTFMSSLHFSVECSPKTCRVQDLGSRNGTTVNGKRVPKAKLRDGDRIHAGRTDFVVRIEHVDTGPSKPVVSRFAETITPGFDPVTDVPEGQTGGISSSLPEPPRPAPARPKSEPVRQKPQPRSRVPSTTASSTQSSSGPLPPPPPPVVEQPRIPSAKLPPQAPEYETDFQKSMASYEAATPEGRLLQILRNQPEPLFALADAVHAPKLLELLRNSGEEYQSLYKDEKTAAVAPYLVRLPPQAPLLKTMLHDGWGHGWGVYLTARVSMADLRGYFRRELMVSLPDGAELFSRFYEPKFFRPFLESCTPQEAARFFGPIGSYFMESDRPEILLQFRNTASGVDKKGHLLSVLE
ncbi:MAG TPA: DUF4123 domain-containing protein [Pyrinomonadaceae bacterium]|nr:DUF4123 domain-containing protein [Pyrinomonadaceae bacterium]